ncbi:MAG: hypothetical protein ACI4B5_08985 [Bacteroidaceae bacterium]
MNLTKRFATCGTLFILMFSVIHAQDIRTDSIGNNSQTPSERIDSLSNELSQIRSYLSDEEKKKETDRIWKRRKYWKIGFDNPSIERTDGESMTWKTDFSVFLQRGKTAYLHSKPIGGMVKFGIDYGFMDLGYAKLKLKTYGSVDASPSEAGTTSGSNSDGFDEIVSEDPSGSIFSMMGIDLGMHKFDYSMHVGPSISINPWKHLIVAAYFHAMPTASGILENESFSYGFACAMSAGLSVSYKVISVGVEGVWSAIKYKQASFDEEDIEDDYEGDFNLFNTKDFKLKQKGPRFYIAFRF